jgi:OOP family OmpA-OmpF porin
METATAAVLRGPYRFTASRSSGRLHLAGTVPDQNVRSAIVERAGEIVGAENVVDELEIRSPVPHDNWEEAVRTLLGGLGKLSEGQGLVVDRAVALEGIAGSISDAEAVRSLMAHDLPELFDSNIEVTALGETTEVGETTCQRLFVALLRDSEIRFATSSAAIEPTSLALLDRLVDVAERCPAATIEISGHTDSQGAEDINLDLSRRRARAVLDYLAGKGVSAERLQAVGYGEGRPIADNSTATGRARNRRIEFKIQ